MIRSGEVEGSHGLAVLVLASDQMSACPFLFQPLRERDQKVGAEIAPLGGKNHIFAYTGVLVLITEACG